MSSANCFSLTALLSLLSTIVAASTTPKGQTIEVNGGDNPQDPHWPRAPKEWSPSTHRHSERCLEIDDFTHQEPGECLPNR